MRMKIPGGTNALIVFIALAILALLGMMLLWKGAVTTVPTGGMVTVTGMNIYEEPSETCYPVNNDEWYCKYEAS